MIRRRASIHPQRVGGCLLFGVVVLGWSGCGTSARLLSENAQGGTVSYPYFEEQDVLASSSRAEALRLIEAKCPAGSRVVREGQIPRITKAVDDTWRGQVSGNGQVSREKQWAIQFTCK